VADATDPWGGLSGDDRDAYLALTNMLKAYGLESLAPQVLGFVQQGYSSTTVTTLLQDTKEYKERFAANETRRKNGLPVLSPGDYLATETAYRQLMSTAGLPMGFYDQPSDFTAWIANDVAPQEVQQRVQVASEMVNNLDPSAKDAFSQFYTHGDMVAYALDRTRATPIIERQWLAAQAAGAAKDNGLSLNQQQAEGIGSLGLTAAQQRAGLGQAAGMVRDTGRLSGIYGGDYTQSDAVEEVFKDNEAAAQKRKGLASQERATFGGSSATTTKSLSTRRGGQV
jgi:hypothetical protein